MNNLPMTVKTAPCKQRDSNIELLRIIAMMLVVAIHAGFTSLGKPTPDFLHAKPGQAAFIFADMAVSVVCVNTFVFISGWFGIKFKPVHICSLLFQTLFFSVLIFMCLCFADSGKWLTPDNLGSILMLHSSDYWFIKSYILLSLFAPILNLFFEQAGKRAIEIFLIIFFSIQSVFAWLSINGISEFCGGYSAVSFIGLYLLARYVRVYGSGIRIMSKSSTFYFAVFFGIAFLQATVAFAVTMCGFSCTGRLFTYTNPLVIVQSLCLFLAFARMNTFRSRAVNYIASSCLAVYLLHGSPFLLRTYYAGTVSRIFSSFPLPGAIAVCFFFILTVFAFSIAVDKVRLRIWSVVSSAFIH